MKLFFKMYNFAMKKFQYYILTILNFIIPKSRKRIFLFDKRFRKDNVWGIADYLSSNDKYKEYKIYYYTKANVSPKKNIRFISNGTYALWNQLRSNYIFYSYTDIKKFKPVRNQIVVDTMHGSPLKNIGYLASKSKFNKMWRHENTFSYILCVSDFFKEIIKEGFGADEKQCLVLGYPRNDAIFSQEKGLYKLDIDNKVFDKIVLWLPTWRSHVNGGKNSESNIDFPILDSDNIDYLNSFLFDANVLLIIKPHPNQFNLPVLNQDYSNIKVFRNEDLEKRNINLYQTFNEVDALLTDYSSVYFDFLLTMKPIGFTIDDFDSYDDKRGFTVDEPLEIMPGTKITNLEELIVFFDDLKEGRDNFYDERKAVNDLANKYQDGNSTKRIIEFLGI